VNSEPTSTAPAVSDDLPRALAEPYAFALVTWPAVVSLMVLLPESWAGYARIPLAVWLAAMHLAAYGRGRGLGFGNAMLFNSGLVALACHSYPSPWTLAWLPALLIGLHAAQRARLNAESRATVAFSPGPAAMDGEAEGEGGPPVPQAGPGEARGFEGS
jgi:hypothetical protein